MHINHKNIYYEPKQLEKDLALGETIKGVHRSHPAYGYRRVALELGINPKRAQRVMQQQGIRPPRRRRRPCLTKPKPHHSYRNELKDQKILAPHDAWCSDVSYIKYKGKYAYLITIEDIFSRQVLAGDVADNHTSQTVLAVMRAALKKAGRAPKLFHSDQGNEFLAGACTTLWEKHGTTISVSDKASPWQNGYQESFFSRFKEEFGDVGRFATRGELIESIYKHIHYYNNERIHSSLKTSPVKFYETFLRKHS